MIEFTDIDLRTDILAARYVKTEIVEVAFAEQSGELASPEGLNRYQAGDALIDMIVRTANGRLTAAEALGHREYVMTKLYRSA